VRQVYTLASGPFVSDVLHRRRLTRAGLTLDPVAYDDARDLWRVLVTGDALPREFEVPDGGYPEEADLRFLINYADGARSLVVIATKTHDAMS
jgi:hypothetical protein